MALGTSHPDLRTRANKVRSAALDHDVDRLHREATALLDAFVTHIDEEQPELLQLSRFTQRMVGRGQSRVLDDLLSLVMEAESSDDACRCEQIGTEAAMRLELQVDQEHRAFAASG